MVNPFSPHRGANIVASPTSASAEVSVATNAYTVRFVNSGSNICYVVCGESPVVATTADTPVLPSTSLVLSKSARDNAVAHISSSGTTLNIQCGNGGL